MNGNYASYNKVFDRSSTEGYATISQEQMLKDHPYASLYAPTLLFVQERLIEEPQPQPAQTLSLNHDSVNINHQNAVRQNVHRELPQPMETPSMEVLRQNTKLKTEENPLRQSVQWEQPQLIEAPSLEVRQSRIRKLQRLLATPSENEENMSTRSDGNNVRRSTMDIGDTSRNIDSRKRMKTTDNRSPHLSLPPDHASKGIDSNSFDKTAFVSSSFTQNAPLGQQSMPQTKSRRSFKSASNASNGNVQSATKPDSWQEMFSKLNAFRAKHGHVDVKQTKGGNCKLANWVRTQRQRLQNQSIPQDQVQLLNSIGFVWRTQYIPCENEKDQGDSKSPRNSPNCSKPKQYPAWEAMYDRYRQYSRNHDHVVACVVAKSDPKLANWIKNQRASFHKGILLKARKLRLDAVGFDFVVQRSKLWKRMYRKLAYFHYNHGHLNVPADNDRGNLKLIKWMDVQRKRRFNDTIVDGEVRSLDLLGFDWQLEK